MLRVGDPMSNRVVEQIALGVSTRGYERSLEPIDESIEARSASNTNAPRALIDATIDKLAQCASRKLDDVDLVAMFIDDAYNSTTAATAKKKLMQLASWLDANGEESAAAGLREGLDETLTVMRLNLPAALRRTFATTNPLDNMNGALRRIARNVKRWKDEPMIRRWFERPHGRRTARNKGRERKAAPAAATSVTAKFRPSRSGRIGGGSGPSW
ncbi:MAG: hypothetical protein FWD17_11920 [Polyangiaceae bacterium]|nr:hypothetical protein [Polyangiaceae bacterium]